MLKVGLVGIGFMGRGHLDNYIRFAKEGGPAQLVAICEVDQKKFDNEFIPGNLAVGNDRYDFAPYRKYASLTEMLDNEQLDYVDIALPTYLHAGAAIQAMEAGCNVLCEKPMALSTEECTRMIETAQRTGKTLMIAQCLRFWPAYQELKRIVDSGEWGKVVCGNFFRGGSTPAWSFENWLQTKERSGGALLDQHIHDVDTIQWLFGTPKAVSCSAVNAIPGSGYDAVSTNYLYEDGKVVNAQDDWTINGPFGFEMIFRVNFEKGCLVLTRGGLTAYPVGGEAYQPELNPENGYYHEMLYFANCLIEGKPVEACRPCSTRETIRIAEAEVRSADQKGALVTL